MFAINRLFSLSVALLALFAAACGGGESATPDGGNGSNDGGSGPGGNGTAGCDENCSSSGGGSTSGGGSVTSSGGTTSGSGKICHPADGDCEAGDTCECILTEDQAASCEAMKAQGIEGACAPEKSFCSVEESFDDVVFTSSCGWNLEEGETYVRPSDEFLAPLWNSNWSSPGSQGSASGKIDQNGYFVWKIGYMGLGGGLDDGGCTLTNTADGPQCKFGRKDKDIGYSYVISFRDDGKEVWIQYYEPGNIPLGEPDYASWNYNY